jgi:molybdopterin-guanine dinucleotide biosynthesis protein A
MGTAKASLEWHGSTLLRHVGGILERAVDGPVVVVRAPGQPLPAIPDAWIVVDDARPDRGPLEALAAGLAAAAEHADVAFVASTDIPLLHPALVVAVLGGLRAQDEICVPVSGGRAQPLAAAYRACVATTAGRLLAADELRLGALLEQCATRRLDVGDAAVVNVNLPADYAAARARPAPRVSVSGITVRAATLGQAAVAARVPLPRTVTLNGVPLDADPQTPVVDGDSVVFS